MAEIKWIKLSVNMFDDEKVKLIRTMPEGDALVIEWIKTLIKATQGMNYNSNHSFSYLIEGEDDMPNDVFIEFGMVKVGIGTVTVIDFERYATIDRECVINPNKMKDLRKLVLERDNFTCTYCGSKEAPFEADHVLPRSRGGLDVIENLVCACRRCNRSKKDKTLDEWLGSD